MNRGRVRRREDDGVDPLSLDAFNPRITGFRPDTVWNYYFIENRLPELAQWRRRYYPTSPSCDWCMVYNQYCNFPQGCAQCQAANRPCTGAPAPMSMGYPQPAPYAQPTPFGQPVPAAQPQRYSLPYAQPQPQPQPAAQPELFDDRFIDPRLLEHDRQQQQGGAQAQAQAQPQPQPLSYSEGYAQAFNNSAVPAGTGGIDLGQSSYTAGLVGTVYDPNRPDASSSTLPPPGGFGLSLNPVPDPSYGYGSGFESGYTSGSRFGFGFGFGFSFFPESIPSYDPSTAPSYFPDPAPAPAPLYPDLAVAPTPADFTQNPAPAAGPSTRNRDDDFITPQRRAGLPANWVNCWPSGTRPPSTDLAGNPINECDACRADRPGYPCDAWIGVSPGVGCTHCKKGDRTCRWGDVRLAPRPDGLTEPISCDRCTRLDILGCSWRNRPSGVPYEECTSCVRANQPCSHGFLGGSPGLYPRYLLGSNNTHFDATCHLPARSTGRQQGSRERQSNPVRTFIPAGPRSRSPAQFRTRGGDVIQPSTFDPTVTRRLNISGRRTDGGQQCLLCASRVSQGHTRTNSRRCNANPSIPRGCDQCSSWGVQCIVDGAALPPTVSNSAGTTRDQAHYSHCDVCVRYGRPCDRKRPCDSCVIFGVACHGGAVKGTFHRGVPGDDQPLYYLRTGFGDGGVFTYPASRSARRPALPLDYHLQYQPSNGYSGVGLGYVDVHRQPLRIPPPPQGQQVNYPVPPAPQPLPPNVPDVPEQEPGDPAIQLGTPIYSPLNIAQPIPETPGNQIPSPSNFPSSASAPPLQPTEQVPQFDNSVFDLPFEHPDFSGPVAEPSVVPQDSQGYVSPSDILKSPSSFAGPSLGSPLHQGGSSAFPQGHTGSGEQGLTEQELNELLSSWTNDNAIPNESPHQTQPDNSQQQAGHGSPANHGAQPINFDSPPGPNPPSPFFIDEPPPVDWPAVEDQSPPSYVPPEWNTTEYFDMFGGSSEAGPSGTQG
ncbi:hypothetical protein F4813DRAFT_386319 [Daldinia decipiens]|uniref:uncharacterized protein n=1 Tax=Daldinia decipiens TaxID=326647 RepID=UPI0020C31044|nr:uncharacterized protein F4813DRAFT_386319 [Daldinia decipiens]KAI1660910.1 hypothetical protein F4813DRAFT_386319 [Daldinia decipiens]